MAARTIPHLARANLGVLWTLPGRMRPFATSTKATSDLIEALSETGGTISQVLDQIHFDADATEILSFFVDHGYGQRRLQGLVA